MPKNSRSKGKRGELELRDVLRAHGHTDAYRGRQYHGRDDAPDVVCDSLPGIHFEAKRCERGNLYDWLQQAIDDAGTKTPIVAHKKNRKPWVAILRLEDLLRIIGA